jgi:gamma-glutamylcyclotransferase (GGCT)/AIG2-like uncharacterized protein YtfP
VRPLVFVYGTLLQGHPNHGHLRGAERLGTHVTEPAFTMLHLGAYPGVRPGGRTAVQGEVYRVSPAALARLDRLEDCPRLFVRTPIGTPWGAAWIYLLAKPPRRRRRIAGGVWPGPGRPG